MTKNGDEIVTPEDIVAKQEAEIAEAQEITRRRI